jgi:hypothetical protein
MDFSLQASKSSPPGVRITVHWVIIMHPILPQSHKVDKSVRNGSGFLAPDLTVEAKCGIVYGEVMGYESESNVTGSAPVGSRRRLRAIRGIFGSEAGDVGLC